MFAYLVITLLVFCVNTSAQSTFPNAILTNSPTHGDFNASSITLEFIPSASPFTVVQYVTKNLTLVCHNRNDEPILAQLSFNWSVADTTMWVVWGIEGTNMTVEANSNASIVIPVYGVCVGKSKLSVAYYLLSNTTTPISVVDTFYQVP